MQYVTHAFQARLFNSRAWIEFQYADNSTHIVAFTLKGLKDRSIGEPRSWMKYGTRRSDRLFARDDDVLFIDMNRLGNFSESQLDAPVLHRGVNDWR